MSLAYHPLFLPSLIVGVTIVLWATSLLPEFITALLFFAAAMMAKIAPPEIFGGFASSAFWLVFSGFVLGIAIRKTGLADRAAQALSASSPTLVADGRQRGTPELRHGVRDALNMGRIALLMPIVAAMARRAGIADGSRGWFGGAGGGVRHLSAVGDDFARQRAESGDEWRGGRLVRYPSELCSLFTAAYAGAWLAERGGACGADLLAVSRQAASTARRRRCRR